MSSNPDVATTPTQPPPHGALPRGLASTPGSSTSTGRFGRMFRHVPVYSQAESSLAELAQAMIQEPDPSGKIDVPLGQDDDDENVSELASGGLRLPAGYTYFGQFVDHDITFDPVSSLERQNDPDALVDFRTPRFDLDSLYGRGPSDQPYLYDPDGVHLALGREVANGNTRTGHDLQRNANDRALIGDPRNDENLIVSQLQVAFIEFHNAIIDKVANDNPGFSPSDVFKLAQQTVRWHYQWVVIHDYLARLVGKDVVHEILKPKAYLAPGASGHTTKPDLRFYSWRETPFMPVEFSVAAYRFGHSIVRPSYLLNDIIPVPRPGVANASRIPLFSGSSNPLSHLNGFRKLPDAWAIQWKYFLPGTTGDAEGPDDAHLPQPSYKLDAELSNPLGTLPVSVAGPEVLFLGANATLAQVLAARNLFRALRLAIPSGQDVARAMGITPLEDDALFGGITLSDPTRNDLAGHAPLWYYILKEAELEANSAHLGPVGGRIVAEVLIGLLAGDPLSFLSVNPTWAPTLPSATPGVFTLSDIINIANPHT